VDTAIVARRNNKKNREFNEAWWQEVRDNTERDQPPFMYLAWKLKLDYYVTPFMWEATWQPQHG
jgi:protein gp37